MRRKFDFVNVVKKCKVDFSPKYLSSLNIHTLSSDILADQSVICSRCEIVSPIASPLCRSSCSVLLRREVSGPIMKNTCWLTQIENTARWESDCSWSTHVTSFSNHCPCTDHRERNPPLWRHTGKDSGLNHYPFVSSIRKCPSDH